MRYSTARLLLGLSSLTVAPLARAATYSLSDNYVGPDFLSAFVHEAISDPTNGRVNYVDQATALAKNLTYASGDTLIMRADDTTVLTPDGPGRDSVRIRSNKTYSTHVVVFDIQHMPEGCGTWPAAWETTETGWPSGGEIDVVEGADNVSPNQSTLHTDPGCTMPGGGDQTGTWANLDCQGGQGCGVKAPTQDSFGPPFNQNGGGWYAMERNNDQIRVWFWSRQDGSVPSEVSTSGSSSVDTDNWGTPVADFPNTQCNIEQYFQPENIIINLTFCGDWAGDSGVYSGAGCPSDCVSYVNNNPSDFSNAYWDIAAVRVYE